MKLILVTGGAGLIGANLCRFLLKKNYKVIAFDNLATSNGENLTLLKKDPRFRFIKHDITKPLPQVVKRKLSEVNEIYHLACPTGVPNLLPLAEEMLMACSIGTRNMLELGRKYGAKVIFASSSEVYGDPKVFPQTEAYTGNVNPVGFRSSYEEGKRFSEALCAMYARKYNVNVNIVRVFNTYGPGASPTESRVVSKFLRLAKNNKPIPVQGTGNQTRTFCYVDDLIEGLFLISGKGKKGEVYNLGGTRQISISDLAKKIIALTGAKSKIKYIKRLPHDHQSRQPDLSKVKKLGWKQKISLEDGLQILINQDKTPT